MCIVKPRSSNLISVSVFCGYDDFSPSTKSLYFDQLLTNPT